jgi:Lon protease-like protein
MQSELDMFPLDVCLLPGESMPLHIFENRYKELINRCVENKGTFGIPFGMAEQHIRAEVRVKKVLKTFADGSLDIIVEALSSFHIQEYEAVFNKLTCDRALVEELKLQQLYTRNSELSQAYLEFRKAYFNVEERKLSFEDQNLLLMARSVGLSRSQKIKFLESSTEEQEALILKQVNYLLFIMRQDKSREFDFLLN